MGDDTCSSKRATLPVLTERFWARVAVATDPDSCWLWTGSIGQDRYGRFSSGRPLLGETRAHRISHVLFVGPIPDGYEVDHQCHNRDRACRPDTCMHRRCIRPDHLDAVPPRLNGQRARGSTDTHCPRGHEYGDRTQKNGRWQICATCQQDSVRRYQQRQKDRRAAEATRCPKGHSLPDSWLTTRRMCPQCHEERVRKPAQTQRRAYVLKTHCQRGHELTQDNTYWHPGSLQRSCRTCRRENAAAYRDRQKAA